MSSVNVRTSQNNATITLSDTDTAVAELSTWLQTVTQANNLSNRCAFRLELVLVEAVTNAIDHGHALEGGGAIDVKLTCAEDRIIALVADRGQPFDPTGVPEHEFATDLASAPIGGLGVHLMRAYTQQLEYRRIGHTNELRMVVACDV